MYGKVLCYSEYSEGHGSRSYADKVAVLVLILVVFLASIPFFATIYFFIYKCNQVVIDKHRGMKIQGLSQAGDQFFPGDVFKKRLVIRAINELRMIEPVRQLSALARWHYFHLLDESLFPEGVDELRKGKDLMLLGVGPIELVETFFVRHGRVEVKVNTRGEQGLENFLDILIPVISVRRPTKAIVSREEYGDQFGDDAVKVGTEISNKVRSTFKNGTELPLFELSQRMRDLAEKYGKRFPSVANFKEKFYSQLLTAFSMNIGRHHL